jgi:hypothetical protein
MISLRLKGGLGNQLFQLAAALHVSKDTNIRLLTRSLKMYKRTFDADIGRLLDLNQMRVSLVDKGTLLDNLTIYGRAGIFLPYFGVNDRNIKYVSARSKKFSILEGYFQEFWTPETLFPIADIFKKNIKVSDSTYPLKDKLVMMHIRGLDFLNDRNLSIIDIDWIARAIDVCIRENDVENILIVTDDIYFAEKISQNVRLGKKFKSVEFHCSTDPLEDFYLLMKADIRIIGNSTFAQWAMLLDRHESVTYSSEYVSVNKKKCWSLQNEKFV